MTRFASTGTIKISFASSIAKVFVKVGVDERNQFQQLDELLNEAGFFDLLEQKQKKSNKNSKDFSILIKPNISIASQTGVLNYTDPNLVEHLICILNSRGYHNIQIVESENVLRLLLEKHTPDVVARALGYKTKVVNLTTLPPRTIIAQDGRSFNLPVVVLDCDFLINFPKARNHCQKKMTGALKNIFGLIPEHDKIRLYHWGESGFSVEEVVSAIHSLGIVDYTIVDFVKSIDGKDEHIRKKQEFSHTFVGRLACGTNDVLIDKYLARKMGLGEDEPSINALVVKTRTNPNINENDVVGDDLSPVEHWARVPRATLWKWNKLFDLMKSVKTILGMEEAIKQFRRLSFFQDVCCIEQVQKSTKEELAKKSHHVLNSECLYHVTSQSYLDDIMKEGLRPDLSDFTIEAIFNSRSEAMGMDWGDPEAMNMTEEELDNDKESLYEEIRENTPEMVFAVELEYLPVILHMMITNPISPLPKSQLVVIAILESCKHLFKEKEVASPVDWISTVPVPAKCLEVMPREKWVHMMEKRVCF